MLPAPGGRGHYQDDDAEAIEGNIVARLVDDNVVPPGRAGIDRRIGGYDPLAGSGREQRRHG